MTAYLTATQAATRLKKSEKTIRRWITEGRLHAHHPNARKNMLAISEDDIEQLAQELAQYEQQPAEDQDTSSLEQRVKQLEQELNNYRLLSGPDLLALGPEDMAHIENRLDTFEQRLSEIERVLNVGTPAQPTTEHATRTRTPRASASTATLEPLEHLPQGSTPHYIFANNHGVKPRTFLDHIHKGYVPSIARQKPNRKETAHWLSPEMQRAAIAYWRANDTSFHDCELCPHTDEIYQRASEDQSSEQVAPA